jgi:hypothetical protein
MSSSHRAAERFRLRAKPVAHLPVEIGQRQPADAAFCRRAEARRLYQIAPQALGIDGEVFHRLTALHAPLRANGSGPKWPAR